MDDWQSQLKGTVQLTDDSRVELCPENDNGSDLTLEITGLDGDGNMVWLTTLI